MRWKCQNALHNRCHLKLYYKISHSIIGVHTWFRIPKLKNPIQKDIYFMYCIKQSVFNPWVWIWFSHFASNQKSEKKVPLGKKYLIAKHLQFRKYIFCNFLMIKKRQECNNSTVYRTRIENILVTQFEVFFWKIKLVGQIQ